MACHVLVGRDVLQRLQQQQVAVRQWPGGGTLPDFFFLVDTSVPLKFAEDGRCYEEDELALVILRVLISHAVDIVT